jgi:hypothetical protein
MRRAALSMAMLLLVPGLAMAQAELEWPPVFPVPSSTYTAKPGVSFAIHGTADGPGFQGYRIEWAPGRDATTGWSTEGITLTAGGTVPIGGQLGTWTPPLSLSGEHTLRVVVTNLDSASQAATAVYVEPDLVSSRWPIYLSRAQGWHSPIPARAADGTTRLIACGQPSLSGSYCHSIAMVGPPGGVSLTRGTEEHPSVGELDPSPGDEVLIGDGGALKIFTADLTPIRQIVPPPGLLFGLANVQLADLDGDGALEILAIGRDRAPGSEWPAATGSLHVYRANGESYSSRYPLPIVAPGAPDGRNAFASMVATDLDGDGRKEIVIAVVNPAATQYSLAAYQDDGSPYAAWPVLEFPAAGMMHPMANDLDHDGRTEIVIFERFASFSQIRVIDRDGTVRPGWPVHLGAAVMTMGDLDRDGREEIIATTSGGARVLRHDGTLYADFNWPHTSFPSWAVVADIDNDTFPELVISYNVATPYAGGTYDDQRVGAIDRNGTLVKEWRLFANVPGALFSGAPAVGDFDGDGRTDIAAHVPLQTSNGWDSMMTVLTTRAPFDPAHADWPFIGHNPQNSRRRQPPRSSSSTIAAVADAYVRDGSSAGANFGRLSELVVKSTNTTGNRRLAYLRFPLASVSGSVRKATLRLHGVRTSAQPTTDSVHAVSGNSWKEAGLTWNNRPALGTRQRPGVRISPAPFRYYEWDVTAFVRAQQRAGASAVSLAVRMDRSVEHGPDTFRSREAPQNRPELVVEVEP